MPLQRNKIAITRLFDTFYRPPNTPFSPFFQSPLAYLIYNRLIDSVLAFYRHCAVRAPFSVSLFSCEYFAAVRNQSVSLSPDFLTHCGFSYFYKKILIDIPSCATIFHLHHRNITRVSSLLSLFLFCFLLFGIVSYCSCSGKRPLGAERSEATLFTSAFGFNKYKQ